MAMVLARISLLVWHRSYLSFVGAGGPCAEQINVQMYQYMHSYLLVQLFLEIYVEFYSSSMPHAGAGTGTFAWVIVLFADLPYQACQPSRTSLARHLCPQYHYYLLRS